MNFINDKLLNVYMLTAIWDGVIFDVPKGQIPGWDCRTGEELWRFYIVPIDEDDPAMATWLNGTEGVGAGNCWIPLEGDEELGNGHHYMITKCSICFMAYSYLLCEMMN